MGQLVPTYEEILIEYENERGEAPDVHWRSLLFILTSVTSLWRLRAFVDFQRGEVNLEGWKASVGPMSHGEKLLADTALHLFNDSNEGPALHDVLSVLDELNWQVFLYALHLRRYGRLPATSG